MIAELLPQSPTSSSQTIVSEPPQASYSTEIFFVARCDVGLGIFANRDIARDDLILTFSGPIIDFAETKRRGPRECMAIQIGENRYIDTRPPGVFVNHSCEPNAGIRQDKHLVALRPISKGEEIRFDYSTTMEEQSFTMQCLCGAPSCRHMVRDFSTLPRQVQDRYVAQRIVMGFIVRKLGARRAAASQHPAPAQASRLCAQPR